MAIATPCPFGALPPELFHIIFSTLDKQDLISVARSTKSLYRLTEPYVWNDIDVASSQLKRFKTTAAQQALVRNAKHVRKLTLTKSLFGIFLPSKIGAPPSTAQLSSSSPAVLAPSDGLYQPALCTHLKQLELSTLPRHSSVKTVHTLSRAVEDSFSALIRQNPFLTALRVNAGMTCATLLQITRHEIPNLQQLNVVPYLSPWTAKLLLEGLPESVTVVQITVNIDHEGDEMDLKKTYDETVPLKLHPELRVLSVAWAWKSINLDEEDEDSCKNMGEREENIMFRFLESCSNPLIEFGLYSIDMLCNERIRRELERLEVVPEVLDLNRLPDSMVSTDQGIASFVMHSSEWKKIDLDGNEAAGPMTAAAILDSCDELYQLNISYTGLKSKDVCDILGRCQQLTSFIAIDRNDPDTTLHPFILAEDLIRLDWPSIAMSEWGCMIKVPRPCGDNDEHGHASNELESHSIQRKVYQKLSQLTDLQLLILGRLDSEEEEVQESWYQTQSLEMTLESGLDELASLKNLVVLDVSYMLHRIGVPELEWMAANWPSLEKIAGLFRGCRDPVPGAREWLKEKKPEWVLLHE